jgi:outer membrane protein TolC
MEQNPVIEHETTLEHALDVARSNAKEAKRLLDDAILKRDAGEVSDDRVTQLQSLLDLANDDLKRVTREQ